MRDSRWWRSSSAQFAEWGCESARCPTLGRVSVAGTIRGAGWLLVAAGAVQSLVAYLRDESANAAGVVPGIAIGFGIISVGAYAVLAAEILRQRRLSWLAFPATLTILAVWSIAVLVSEDALIATFASGGRGLVGLVVFLGYFTVLATVCFLVILPALHLLGWAADQIPAFRRRGVGDALRRGGRPSSRGMTEGDRASRP